MSKRPPRIVMKVISMIKKNARMPCPMVVQGILAMIALNRSIWFQLGVLPLNRRAWLPRGTHDSALIQGEIEPGARSEGDRFFTRLKDGRVRSDEQSTLIFPA